jgi:plasmid stability protein
VELHLPPDTETMLRVRATVDGKTAEAFAVEAIEEKVASEADVMLPNNQHQLPARQAPRRA